LRELLVHDCREDTLRMLVPHEGLLLHLVDASLQTPIGLAAFRSFLYDVNQLHASIAELKQQCADLTQRWTEAMEGQSIEGELCVRTLEQRERERLAKEAERHSRIKLEADVQRLFAKLGEASEMQRRQCDILQTATQSFAQSDYNLRRALHIEVENQAALNARLLADHRSAIEHLSAEALRAKGGEQFARAHLEKEKVRSAQLRVEVERLRSAIRPWEAVQAARLPCILEVARFLSDVAPDIVRSSEPGRVVLPVLALEWAPDARLDVSIAWRGVTPNGFFGILSRLCVGELRSDSAEMELTVGHSGGRLFGALDAPLEAPRLAALLAFQALRLDTPVMAACNIRPMPPALYSLLQQLAPKARSTPLVGAGTQRARAAYVQPQGSAEAILRGLLRGCPLEQPLLAALQEAHVAH